MLSSIGIIYNPKINGAYELCWAIKNKISSSEIYNLDNMPSSIDFAIVVGGDGTFLKASRYFSIFEIPVLGFNMGHLGYLAQAKPNDINNVIEKLKNNQFSIQKRLMLKASASNLCALNDIVIKGQNLARTSTLDLYINNKKLCSYVSDGLIIATPTGSTAYSLSAGGPIIHPNLNCFLIIPICPHTLNTRPLVIPSDEIIKIKAQKKNENDEILNVSFDGQEDITIKDEIEITKNDNFANLLILDEQKDKFYDILKEKLHWLNPLGN